jgi:hypothetical protein
VLAASSRRASKDAPQAQAAILRDARKGALLRMTAVRAANRHCEERSDEAIQSSLLLLDCFAEPVIGRAFARPVGADPLARNDAITSSQDEYWATVIAQSTSSVIPDSP